MKVKIHGKKYWAVETNCPPFIFIYDNFFKMLKGDWNIYLTWGYFLNTLGKKKEETKNA